MIRRRWALVAAATALLAACGQSNVMRDQRSVQPNEAPILRTPPGAMPTETQEPAATPTEAARLENPFRADVGLASLERGELAYTRFCGHCHGKLGRGWTSIGSSLDPSPGDLVASASKLSDGELFAVETFGKGKSPPLRAVIPVRDRWHIVNYVRTLEGRRAGLSPAWGQ